MRHKGIGLTCHWFRWCSAPITHIPTYGLHVLLGILRHPTLLKNLKRVYVSDDICDLYQINRFYSSKNSAEHAQYIQPKRKIK